MFVLRDKDGNMKGIVTLHADVGLIFVGDPKAKTYKEARRKINDNF